MITNLTVVFFLNMLESPAPVIKMLQIIKFSFSLFASTQLLILFHTNLIFRLRISSGLGARVFWKRKLIFFSHLHHFVLSESTPNLKNNFDGIAFFGWDIPLTHEIRHPLTSNWPFSEYLPSIYRILVCMATRIILTDCLIH